MQGKACTEQQPPAPQSQQKKKKNNRKNNERRKESRATQGPWHMPKMQPQCTRRNTPISSPPRIKAEQQEATPCSGPGHRDVRLPSKPCLLHATTPAPAACPPCQNPKEEVGLVAHLQGLCICLFWLQRRCAFT